MSFREKGIHVFFHSLTDVPESLENYRKLCSGCQKYLHSNHIKIFQDRPKTSFSKLLNMYITRKNMTFPGYQYFELID